MSLKPYRRYFSGSEEIMQITLTKGEWIQVCFDVGTPTEPRYEIVQLCMLEDGTPELRGNIPIRKWHHEAQPLDEGGRP